MEALDDRQAIGFGPFTLTKRPLRLERDGDAVTLRPQALQLLSLLANNAGALVTQAQIRERLWGERHVDFASGTHLLIREIRHALEDNAENPAFIETVPRQGYRFIAETRLMEAAADRAAPRLGGKFSIRQISVAAAGISAIVLGAFAVVLSGVLTPKQSHEQTAHSPAHDDYLKGAYLFQKGGAENFAKSEQHFLQALTADSNYVPARIGLAEVSLRRGDYDKAETLAQEALNAAASDTERGGAQLVLGLITEQRDWNWREAERLIDEALRLDPHNARAHAAKAGLLTILGDNERAITATNRAMEIDPVSALVRTDHGWFLYYNGDLPEALRFCKEADDLAPENGAGAYCRFKAFIVAGETEGAAKAAARLVEFWNGDDALKEALNNNPSRESLDLFFDWRRARIDKLRVKENFPSPSLAAAYAEMGDFAEAAAMIEKAVQERARLLPLYLRDPIFEPIHNDPRYIAALHETGIDLAGVL